MEVLGGQSHHLLLLRGVIPVQWFTCAGGSVSASTHPFINCGAPYSVLRVSISEPHSHFSVSSLTLHLVDSLSLNSSFHSHPNHFIHLLTMSRSTRSNSGADKDKETGTTPESEQDIATPEELLVIHNGMNNIMARMEQMRVDNQQMLQMMQQRLEEQQQQLALQQQSQASTAAVLEQLALHGPQHSQAAPALAAPKQEIKDSPLSRNNTSDPNVVTPTPLYRTSASDLPKMPVKMQEFTGHNKDQNIQSWVDQLTTVKRIAKWSDELIIKHCAMLLSDSAQQWYLSTGYHITDDWDKFSKELIKRFTVNINPWMATRYTQEIKQRAAETARDFMDRVRRELRLINIESEERVCEVFLNGARESIAAGIIRSIGRDPVDTKELVDIASRLEMAERMEKEVERKKTVRQQTGAFVPSQHTTYTSGQQLQLTRKTCFNCGAKDHMARECPKPQRPRTTTSTSGASSSSSSNTRTGDQKPWLPLEEWKATLECTVCKGRGHTAKFCPRNRQITTEKKTTTTVSNMKGSGTVNGGSGSGKIRTVTAIEDEEDDYEQLSIDMMEGQDEDEEQDEYNDEFQEHVMTIGNKSDMKPTDEYMIMGYVSQ